MRAMARGRRISDELVAEARRLRSEGMSAKQVAAITGISVGTLYNMDMEPELRLVAEYRCGVCGNKVYFEPCQICESGL